MSSRHWAMVLAVASLVMGVTDESAAESSSLDPARVLWSKLELDSLVLGRRSQLDLWVDPVSGAAFQRTQLERGHKVRHNRHRSLRFTHEGVFNATYRASDDTVDKPFEEWPLSETLEPFPDGMSRRAVVTEPSALLYLLAAGDLDQVGETMTTLVFSKNRVMQIRLVVVDLTEIKVDYTEDSDAGSKPIRGRREVVRIRLESTPMGVAATTRTSSSSG